MADLEIRKVSKSFKGVHALNEVDFTANRGEVRALLGENGAGKSTLIKILSGAIQADAGEITLFGKPLKIRSPADAMRAGISTVYQELSLVPDLSIAQNIFLDRDVLTGIGTYSRQDLHARTLELFERLQVDGIDPDQKVGDISLAKRQVIEIVKAIARDPSVVILDEATSALSENRVEWLLKLARKLSDQGKIVIFISHRMSEIRFGCDTITVFRNGRNVGELTMDETRMDEIISLMLGRKIAGFFPEKTAFTPGAVALETVGLTVGGQLRSVSLSLRYGEVLGVGGLAGQGQLPLFLGLFGVYKGEGEIRIDGKRVSIRSPRDSFRHGVALIPEDRSTQGLIMPFSISFNITLPMLQKIRARYFLSRRKESEIVDQFMGKLDIRAGGPSTPVMNLSGGNQQKVVLAKSLASGPKILLMYDITRGVDVGTKKEIFKLMRELAESGSAILFYSTDLDELINVCDEVVVMHDGRIGARLGGSTLTKEDIMIASMGGHAAPAGQGASP
jgi:ABC-type sugar transport system ATPase subunit